MHSIAARLLTSLTAFEDWFAVLNGLVAVGFFLRAWMLLFSSRMGAQALDDRCVKKNRVRTLSQLRSAMI